MKTNKNATVICPLCGGKVNIIEYSDLFKEFGKENWKDVHGFIPVCYQCGSDYMMCDTREKAISAVTSIPKIKERITYCTNCAEDVEYCLGQTSYIHDIRGCAVKYPELAAFCPICGNEVYVPEINDINCDTRERAYKEVVSAR